MNRLHTHLKRETQQIKNGVMHVLLYSQKKYRGSAYIHLLLFSHKYKYKYHTSSRHETLKIRLTCILNTFFFGIEKQIKMIFIRKIVVYPTATKVMSNIIQENPI